jgi:hypothetical protein
MIGGCSPASCRFLAWRINNVGLHLEGTFNANRGKETHSMPIKSKYLFVASMDVDSDKEALFNEVYDSEHVPNLLKVPGVQSVARMEGVPFGISIGGEEKRVPHDGPSPQRALRNRRPSCSGQPGLGEGCRSRSLVQRGASIHPQPAPCAL